MADQLSLFDNVPAKEVFDAAPSHQYTVYFEEDGKRVYVWWNKKPTSQYDPTMKLLRDGEDWERRKPSKWDTTRKVQGVIKRIYDNWPDDFAEITLKIGLWSEFQGSK